MGSSSLQLKQSVIHTKTWCEYAEINFWVNNGEIQIDLGNQTGGKYFSDIFL